MSTNQEQPGQVSPSGELVKLRDAIDSWVARHDSVEDPFNIATIWCSNAATFLQLAIEHLRKDRELAALQGKEGK